MKKFKDNITKKIFIPVFTVTDLTTDKPMYFLREFKDDIYGEPFVIEKERFQTEFEELHDCVAN